MRLRPGSRLGPYEIESALGSGGMGEVYRGRDTRLGRSVAIKVVSEHASTDPAALVRLEREARAVAALSHPNVLAIHDFGSADGVTYAVMELLEGEPLDRRLATERITDTSALTIAASISDGLASAHAKGIVHRDLKPANIFITRDGIVKILDFGLAKHDPLLFARTTVRSTDATASNVLLGTVGYMAPEQVRGQAADARTDIFALGCVLYEMLAGRKAFTGSTPAETLAAILRDPPGHTEAAKRSIPPRIAALVHRCLAKNPDDRFQSARDVSFALRELVGDLQHQPVSAKTLTRMPHVRRFVAAAIVLLTSAAAVLVLNGRIRRTSSDVSKLRSIAVLPLTNLSAEGGQDYFADGITEELTTRLAKIGSWRVTSKTSAMGYRDTSKKIPQIASELDVDAIIIGSVVREGTRVKVSAQLVDGRSDRHLWADSFERDIESVLTIEADIARAIAAEVNVTLTPDRGPTADGTAHRLVPTAFDAYVRGRHAWDKRGESDLREAIGYFQDAIDADPTYAAAYAGLADSYAQLGYGSYISPEDAFPRAAAAARRALELDPDLAEAHASLGYTLMYYDWNFVEAEREFKRALTGNPSYAVAHQWYAYLLTAMERPIGEAEDQIAAARTLDPLSVPINIDRAYILHYYNRNDNALRSIRLALEMNPKYAPAYFWLTRIYTALGRYDAADAAVQNIGPLRSWTPAMAARGFLYAKAGRREEALRVLSEFDALTRQGRYASSYAIAIVHAGLGDRERAFATLEAAYRERSHWLVWLRRDPRWDEVRSDRRFSDLVARVGLAPR